MTSQSLPLPDPERAKPEDLLAHAAWVRRLARALVGDTATADDVVQDTWLRALRHPPAADRPVRPWLSRVVANVASNRRRGDRRRADHETAPPPEADAPSPQAIAAEIEMQRLLLDAIDTLGEAQRSTLVRHYFHGQSAAAIARADAVSETTVRTRIAHAIEALRKKLDDRHRGDRSAWLALVIPCARHETHVAATATATVAGTLIAMNVLWKIGIAAVVLAIGLGAYELSVNRAVAPRTPDDRGRVADTDPLAESPDIAPTGTEPKRIVLGATPEATATPTPLDDVGYVETTVHDAHGAPIAGALLTCVDNSSGDNVPVDGIPTWTTDADGHARRALPLSKLPPPSMGQGVPMWWTHVELSAPGHVTVTESVSFQRGGACRITIVLADGGEVLGRVVDGKGVGVAGATVDLIEPDVTIEELEHARTFGLEDRVWKAQTKTAVDGSFEFRGVASASYRAWTMPGARVCAVSARFELHTGARFELPPLVVEEDPDAITGTLLMPDGTPCELGEAISFETPTHPMIRGTLGARGEFVIKCPERAVIDAEFYGGHEPDEGVAVVKGIHSGTRDLVVRLLPPHWIEAHVHDRSGKPITAFSIGVNSDSGGSVNGVRDHEDGTLRVRVPTHRFTVTAMAKGFFDRTSDEMDPEHAPATIDFALESAPVLQGRVVLDGAGVNGAEVRLVRPLPAGTQRWHNGVMTPFDVFRDELETTSGADGSFAFTLSAGGTYVVCAKKSDDVASGETGPFSVDPTLPPTELVVALSHGGTLEGSILTQPGDESSFRWIEIIRPTGETHDLPIETGGAYRFEHLAPGRWWIRRAEEESHEGHETRDGAPADPIARTFEIVEGQSTHFDLDVRATPAPVLVGHVAIAGCKCDGWTARLRIRDSWDFSNDLQKVSADGSFRLGLQATGVADLVLESPVTADRAQRIETEVRLAFGVNTWSLEIPTGSLTVTGDGGAAGLLSHVDTLPDGTKLIAQFKWTPGSTVVLDHVAAGVGRILDASGKVLAEVDVPNGGPAQIVLR